MRYSFACVSGAILWTISEHAFILHVTLCVSLQSLYMNWKKNKKCFKIKKNPDGFNSKLIKSR